MTIEPEHLIKLNLKDGSSINFSRTEEHEVIIERGGHQVNLGKASGQVTLDLLALFEPLGKFEEDTNDTTTAKDT